MAILMKAGDTAPVARATLFDAAGNPAELTGATVRFVMASASEPRTVVIEAEATNEQDGVVSYAWAAGDTTDPGSYVAEFEVTYADGTVQTFPTVDYIPVTIEDDLGGSV